MSALSSSSADLDTDSFKAIAALAYEVSGLTLVEEKRSMIRSRLRHRLRALQLPDFPSYTSFLASADGQGERQHLISALTTNVSHFFREDHHFDGLRERFVAKLPTLRAGNPMRVWSAGSSNGQEALSAAITLLEAADDAARLDIKILGTDIDTEVVKFARTGIYPERLTNGIPVAQRQKYFTRVDDGSGEPSFEASPVLQNMIRFNVLNLLGPWPMNRKFDIIFCRNVVIYFDGATQQKLWPRFKDAMAPDGLFFLGHSERIADPEAFGFSCIGPTTYAAHSKK